MLLPDRIVTQLPLTLLWTDEKELQAKRKRYLDREIIKKLLKQAPIVFVLADIGSKLKWIDPNQCYRFWKEEIQERLAENPDKFYLNDFPDGYAYFASEWTSEDGEPIILFEKAH